MEASFVIFSTLRTVPALLAAGGNTRLVDAAIPLFTCAIIIAVTIMVMITRRRYVRSRQGDTLPARELFDQLKNETGAKRELEVLMLELDELARQLMGRLDSRFAKLEATIKDADERIERLNRMIRAQEGKSALDVTVDELGTVGVASAGRSNSARGEPPDPHADVHHLADQGLSALEIATKVGRSTGEIELILSLRRVKVQAAAVSARH